MNEKELIEQLKDGRESAFRFLVETYQHMVFNTVLGIVQQREEAEDLAQEVFIQVYQQIAKFRGDAKLSTWIYRIATTKALEKIRKQQAKKRMGKVLEWFGLAEAGKEPPVFHHPGVQLEQKEQAAILMQCLQRLPEQQKLVFILVKTEGCSYEEAAAVLQVSVKAVEGLMHRAKENLRIQLRKTL